MYLVMTARTATAPLQHGRAFSSDEDGDGPTSEDWRRIVSDILPERNVFMPADFRPGKLETISGILRADERRVCMLVGEPALVLLRHLEASFGTIRTKSGVRHHQYINGKPWVPFTHDTYVLFEHDMGIYPGVTHELETEIQRRRIHECFCPPASRECVICHEPTVMDIEDKVIDSNVFPFKTHPDGNIFQCNQCLGVVCAGCYIQYFYQNHACPMCRKPVPHMADFGDMEMVITRLPSAAMRTRARAAIIICLAARD